MPSRHDINGGRAAYERRLRMVEDILDDPASTDAELAAAKHDLDGLADDLDRLEQEQHDRQRQQARERSREQYTSGGAGMSERLTVNEPDLYSEHSGSFFRDVYLATLKGDYSAKERVDKHQQFEMGRRENVERYAITSSTLGGIIPPAYLIDLYAKASRAGRVFANEVNNTQLPDVGMSVVLPRLTQGTAAAAQTTQNTAVVTQDVTETDLTVPVNTVAGYSPVSRQALERAAYSDKILFEDLTARYWAILDSYCINGSGSNNQPLGLLNTSGIATSTASTATVAGIWPKIADIIQQVNTNTGGLGYVATKIFMHPRRWGFFEGALDSSNRPLIVPSGPAMNPIGTGGAAGYGYVGNVHGLQCFTDANIPVTLGASTNQDAIIVIADPIVHLFERANDPVTVAFEQTAATSLQVQLICFGYFAFTAGRYPSASGAVTGAGLVPPTF